MYIHPNRHGSHVVMAVTTNGLGVKHEGSRSNCHTWIRHMAKAGAPTHFYYVIRNTDRAAMMLRNRLFCSACH